MKGYVLWRPAPRPRAAPARGLLCAIALGTGLVIAAAGCGKKGAPQPPLLVRPEALKGFKIRQRGSFVFLTMQEPATRTDGSPLPESSDVILRLSSVPEPILSRPASREQKLEALRAPGLEIVSWIVPREEWERYRVARRLEIPIPIDSLDLPPVEDPNAGKEREIGFVAEVQEGKLKRSLPAGPVKLALCEPPAAPAAFEARIADGGILLWWEGDVDPDDKVHLYKAASRRPYQERPYRRLDPGERRFLDPETVPGETYRYQIRFGSGEKATSCESNPLEATATAADIFPPSAPEGLAAAAEDSLIRLFWSPGKEADLAGYRLYRSAGPEEPFLPLTDAVLTSTTYADTEVERGRTYTYVVTAVDSAVPPNESRWSAPARERMP